MHRRCSLQTRVVLVSAVLLLFPSLVLPATRSLIVQNEPHLQHARALVQKALKAGGVDVRFTDAPKGNERRNLYQISSGQVHIDLMPATPDRLALVQEGKLLMVPVPLDRGLLGFRINLLLEKHRNMLAHVKGAEDLKRFSMGQNVGWMDVAIYRAAGIPTKEVKAWANGEFARQMEAGLLDLFPLGLEETLTYFLPHFRNQYPQLTVDPHLIIRYPWYRFVWVAATPEGKELQTALEQGFDRIVANGDFLKLWNRYKEVPSREVLQGRRFIDIDNPFYSVALVPAKWRNLLITPD
ncbi:MAG: amino acid ABC transporter substrate-binding protein [Desulfobulbus sp.]|nr:amino acid ABC transporter substrate-binding protein [Desulfobulbus sp.]